MAATPNENICTKLYCPNSYEFVEKLNKYERGVTFHARIFRTTNSRDQIFIRIRVQCKQPPNNNDA